MISLTRNVFKPASQFLNTNAPAILTAFGAVGVVGTAVLTARATFKAADVLRDARLDRASELTESGGTITADNYEDLAVTGLDAVKLVWPLYIGAVFSGVLSCGAIVMSHRISSKRAAVLAAAYALNEGKLEEYQDKIKEKFGVKKEKEARTELRQDQINRDYDNMEFINDPLAGLVQMREDYTGRFFWSTREKVDSAVNQINARIFKEGSARLSDFYDLLKISHVSTSDYFGWVKDEHIMSIDWDTCTTPDGTEAVHCFEYTPHPIQDPEREAGRSFR